MGIEAVAEGIAKGLAEGPAKINLGEFRPMTIGDIGTTDLGGVLKPNIGTPLIGSPIILQAEEVAANAWKVPDVQVALIWNEIRAPQPPLNAENLIRAFSAKAAMEERAFSDPVIAQRVKEFASQAGIRPEVSQKWVENSGVKIHMFPHQIHSQEAEIEEKEKDRSIVSEKSHEYLEERQEEFKEDETASAYRIAKVIAVSQEMGDEISGEELAREIGGETEKDRSKAFSQLGINDQPDNSYIGFRHEIAQIGRNIDRKTVLERVLEAGRKHRPIKLGINGKSVTSENVEEVFDRKSYVKAMLKKAVTKIRSITRIKKEVVVDRQTEVVTETTEVDRLEPLS